MLVIRVTIGGDNMGIVATENWGGLLDTDLRDLFTATYSYATHNEYIRSAFKQAQKLKSNEKKKLTEKKDKSLDDLIEKAAKKIVKGGRGESVERT